MFLVQLGHHGVYGVEGSARVGGCPEYWVLDTVRIHVGTRYHAPGPENPTVWLI